MQKYAALFCILCFLRQHCFPLTWLTLPVDLKYECNIYGREVHVPANSRAVCREPAQNRVPHDQGHAEDRELCLVAWIGVEDVGVDPSMISFLGVLLVVTYHFIFI